MNIVPVDRPGSYRTGTLSGLTAEDIEQVLGFKANVEDDPDKVKYSWGFNVDGKFVGIWDYKLSINVETPTIFNFIRIIRYISFKTKNFLNVFSS